MAWSSGRSPSSSSLSTLISQGRKALVVDDVSDSGASIIKAREHIREKGASEVRIATVHIKPWSRFIPDYYAESVE